MADPDGKTSDLGRTASLRTSLRLSTQAGEDDDYDIEAMGISDGFRPAEVAQNHPSITPIASQLDSTTARLQNQSQRPSSIAKEHRPHESLTLRNDGSAAAGDSSLRRVGSVSTTSPPSVRPESPYQGPTGPSFPYQMYQQNVRPVRTPSLASSMTARASERSYNGPHRPAHPYQMYPQNTVLEAEEADRSTSAPIPVGFTGTTDNYQRRIGSEGEEVADMIGPDGHTEQLPPYTRYPEEVYTRKALGIEPPAAREPPAAIAGAGGIGLATHNPEFDSSVDLHTQGEGAGAGAGAGDRSPQSHSVRSFETESQHDINQAALALTEEKKPQKKWKRVAKRRVWGVVPCWSLCLTASILVMLAIVLGTVLGFFLSGPKHATYHR
jgi:hypothetical protein